MRRMFSLRKEKFIAAFMKWCERWKEFLNERTLLISGKATYTQKTENGKTFYEDTSTMALYV